MTAPGQKRERLKGEERRAQIIAAALEVFAQKGFNGARTKEIAELAGISETLVFQHFGTKEELYGAALHELFHHHPVLSEVEDKIAEKDDFGVFSTIASHLIRHNQRDPRIMRLAIFSALEGRHFMDAVHRGGDIGPPISELLRSYVQQRIDDKAFKPVNAQVVAQLFIAAVNMYVADQTASISGPPLPFSDEEVVQTLVTVVLDGLSR